MRQQLAVDDLGDEMRRDRLEIGVGRLSFHCDASGANSGMCTTSYFSPSGSSKKTA